MFVFGPESINKMNEWINVFILVYTQYTVYTPSSQAFCCDDCDLVNNGLTCTENVLIHLYLAHVLCSYNIYVW